LWNGGVAMAVALSLTGFLVPLGVLIVCALP
jgi:hypothetical protein